MKSLLNQEIASYPEGQRIWLVRASAGKHLNNFIKHGVVAISHIDKAISIEKLTELPSTSELRGIVYKHYNSTSSTTEEPIDEELHGEEPEDTSESADNPEKNTSTESRINQVTSFTTKINVGDLMLSLNKESIVIGVCTSDAYIKHNTLTFTTTTPSGKTRTDTLNYKLRRDVSWFNPISRQLVGSSLRKPLLARKTLSNLDDHWDKIYSLIFPIFTRGNHTYFSNRINSTDKVGTRSISRLLEYVADTQIIADAILRSEFNEEFLHSILESEDISAHDRSVSQAEFMSPGNLYYAVENLAGVSPKKYAKILLLLLIAGLYGCDEGSTESESLSNQLSSLLNQRSMIDERNDEVSANPNTDAMLQQLRNYSKSKKVDSIAKNLQITIGISGETQTETAAAKAMISNSNHPTPLPAGEKQSEIKQQINLELE